MTKEEKDLIQRAQDIQRYTENRCNTLEERIAEQEETIDAQDEKINFYVSKMNENILKRQALEKENAELKAKLKGFENGDVAWQGDMDKTIKQNLELKEQNELLSKRITELQADKGRFIDENSLTRVLIDRCKELGIKDLYHLKDLLELAEENAELKEFAEKLSEQHADEWQKQQEVITELKEQIEKMKCCGNCINHYDLCYCELDRKEVNASNVCNKWEWEKEE